MPCATTVPNASQPHQLAAISNRWLYVYCSCIPSTLLVLQVGAEIRPPSCETSISKDDLAAPPSTSLRRFSGTRWEDLFSSDSHCCAAGQHPATAVQSTRVASTMEMEEHCQGMWNRPRYNEHLLISKLDSHKPIAYTPIYRLLV